MFHAQTPDFESVDGPAVAESPWDTAEPPPHCQHPSFSPHPAATTSLQICCRAAGPGRRTPSRDRLDRWGFMGNCWVVLFSTVTQGPRPCRSVPNERGCNRRRSPQRCFSLICGLHCFVRRPAAAAAVGARVKSTATCVCVCVGETAVCAETDLDVISLLRCVQNVQCDRIHCF